MALVITMEFANFSPLRNETEMTFKRDGVTVFHCVVPDTTDQNVEELIEGLSEDVKRRLEGF